MRRLCLLIWLLVPLLAAAYHYGPGQRQLHLDDAAVWLERAGRAAAADDTETAVDAYDQALEILPGELVDQRRKVRLEKARLQMSCGMLPEAYLELDALTEELRAEPTTDADLQEKVLAASANAEYYLTWLMRLEGAPQEEWEPEIEASRQAFRRLAEEADARKDQASGDRYREDLESAVRLARMSLDELQGLSIPKQCRGCCSGKCAGKGKCKKPGRCPGGGPKQKDVRGASSGPPPDDRGS